MKNRNLTSATWVLCLALAACQPKSNPSSPQTPGPAGDPTKFEGTVSGGGGNGIDGRMLENYSVNVSTLPEYRRYIGPVLRKLSRGRPDILVSYLQWAVRHKAWYMIPRPLPELPKEQTALAFSSDQLAIHTNLAVYIHSPTYTQRTDKEKASLLMHEMVMAARFLMKKTPKEQCEALRDDNLQECGSQETMELAKTRELTDAERNRLDAADHDSVRLLTLFLLEPQQDLSAESVALERKKLGFEFPWDQTISQVTFEDLELAYRRGQLAGDRLIHHLIDAENKEIKQLCLLPIFVSQSSGYRGVRLDFSGSRFVYASANEDELEIRGVLDPRGTKQVVDLIRFAPALDPKNTTDGTVVFVTEFYLAREDKPRLIEARVIAHSALVNGDEVELIPNRKWPVDRCVLEP